MTKKKRRNSQVYNFEQTEETLEGNERLRELYTNKSYVHPGVKELETIIEESNENMEQWSRRYTATVSPDGGLILGKQLGKRMVMEYKYLKQDDQERLKRRKAMVKKQWKGRKMPKMKCLDAIGEQKLLDLIDLKDESVFEMHMHHEDESKFGENPFTSRQVYDEDRKEIVGTDQSIMESDSTTPIYENNSTFTHGREKMLFSTCANQSLIEEKSSSNAFSNTIQNKNQSGDSLAALVNKIPENELSEMLDTSELLFCGSGKCIIDSEQDIQQSVRRSARLNLSHGIGTDFIEDYVVGRSQSGKRQKYPHVSTEVTKKDDKSRKEDIDYAVLITSPSIDVTFSSSPIDPAPTSQKLSVFKVSKKVKTKRRRPASSQKEGFSQKGSVDLNNITLNPMSNSYCQFDDFFNKKDRLVRKVNVVPSRNRRTKRRRPPSNS